MSVTVTKSGIVAYQSKLLSRKQAERFAQMVRANPRFGLAWLEYWKASDPRRFVCYLPRSAEKQQKLRQRYQDQIADKAREQLDAGLYEVADDGWGGWIVTKLADGTTHDVTPFGCDCIRRQTSLRKAKLACKHQIMVTL